MNNKLLNPWPQFDEDEITAVSQILKSGKVNAWTGNETTLFQKEFADFCNVSHSIAMANGTLALWAAYQAIGLTKGDEIITTPRSFIATASTASLMGARTIFADVDPNSGLITPKTIAPLITSRTKAISVVHLAGWPAEMTKISELAKHHGIAVIEDCAQAHGAGIYKKGHFKSVGSLGDIAAWSFCQDKIITTGGEGGMVTTNNQTFWEKMWSIKDHGKAWNAVTKTNHPIGFRWLHENFGSNFRLTEMQSAIGRKQLKRLNSWSASRERNALSLAKSLSSLTGLRIPLPSEDVKHAWYKFHVFVKPGSLLEGWSRDRIIAEISASGYPAGSGSCSEIYLEKCFKDNDLSPKDRLPIAKNLGETSLMFLVHPTITSNQISSYGEAIKRVLIKAQR